MKKKFNRPVLMFIVLTYLLFWCLFGITGILVYSEAPWFLQKLMINICAWSSTFVLLLFFNRFMPDETRRSFLKSQFNKVEATDFIFPALIQLALSIIAVTAVFLVNGTPAEEIKMISAAQIVPLLLINITSGPMGEELGWRAYVLREFGKKYNLLVSSVLIGLIWGFWHFPIWLVSGMGGMKLLSYAGAFMLGIISFSVFITWFYTRKKNIIIAVWIHFLFNLLMQIVIIEDNKFILFISLLYFVVSAVIVVLNKRLFLKKVKTEIS